VLDNHSPSQSPQRDDQMLEIQVQRVVGSGGPVSQRRRVFQDDEVAQRVPAAFITTVKVSAQWRRQAGARHAGQQERNEPLV